MLLRCTEFRFRILVSQVGHYLEPDQWTDEPSMARGGFEPLIALISLIALKELIGLIISC
jgi:hypothetical protein